MDFTKSDLWFSELLVKCKRLLKQDKIDTIFTILTRLKLPKYGKVMNAKGQWMKLNQDFASGKLSSENFALQLIQFRELMSELLKEIETAYLKDVSSVEKSNPQNTKSETENLRSNFKPETITLEKFIDIWLGKDISPNDRKKQLQLMDRSVFTWCGNAGSISMLNKYNPNSDLYLIFWPLNDNFFMLDPIIAFFSFENKKVLTEIERGDKVTIRGLLELSDEAPRVALRNCHLLKVQKKKKFR